MRITRNYKNKSFKLITSSLCDPGLIMSLCVVSLISVICENSTVTLCNLLSCQKNEMIQIKDLKRGLAPRKESLNVS